MYKLRNRLLPYYRNNIKITWWTFISDLFKPWSLVFNSYFVYSIALPWNLKLQKCVYTLIKNILTSIFFQMILSMVLSKGKEGRPYLQCVSVLTGFVRWSLVYIFPPMTTYQSSVCTYSQQPDNIGGYNFTNNNHQGNHVFYSYMYIVSPRSNLLNIVCSCYLSFVDCCYVLSHTFVKLSKKYTNKLHLHV
jgi:hypothetical protein